MTTSKNLQSLSTKEYGQLFPIIIQAYSDEWPKLFEMEKSLIVKSFAKAEIERIDHIGSTAIPGLKAKPTIDILLQVSEQMDTQKLEHGFQSLGYQLTHQPDNPPPHMSFIKGYTAQGFQGQAYHVHVRYLAHWDEIKFRDYLLAHHKAAKDYEVLKLQMAEKYKYNREAYTESKTAFIEKIKQAYTQNSDD